MFSVLYFLAQYWSAMDIPSMHTKSGAKVTFTKQDDRTKLFLWVSVFLTGQLISGELSQDIPVSISCRRGK